MDVSKCFNLHTWQGKVVASATVVAAVYGVYLVARKPKKEVNLEQLIEILETIAHTIEETAQMIAKQEKLVRQKMKMSGHAISEDEIFMYCKQEFENTVHKRENEIYQKFKITEAACKRAWNKHRSHEKVAKLEQRIVRGAAVFDPKEPDLPDSFTEQKLVDLTKDLVFATTKAMESVIAELAKQGITMASSQAQFFHQFQQRFQQKSEKIQREIPSKYGITDAMYNSAVEKYQDSPGFQEQMEVLKRNQERVFDDAGIGAGR